MIDSLAASLDPEKVAVQLHSIVTELRWQRDKVQVLCSLDTASRSRSARRQAIITLPLGVLQLPALAPGSVLFTPTLPRKQAGIAVAHGARGQAHPVFQQAVLG